jgi:hypothetical protein
VGPEMYHLRALGTSPHEVMQMVQAGLLHFPTMRAQARVRARITVSLPLPLSLALTDYPYIRANEEAYAGRESVLATGLRILEAAGPVDITRSELSAGPWRNVLTGEMETGYPEPTPGSHPEPLGACSPLTAPLVWLACPFRPLTADARGRGHEAFSETVEWVDQCARCETPDPGVQAPTTQNVAWGPASAVGLSLAGNSPADWLAAEMNEWRVCGALQPEAYARACALKGEDIIAGYD